MTSAESKRPDSIAERARAELAKIAHPRDVFCPHCAAPSGRPCMTSAGVRYRGGPKGSRTVHSARIDAYEGIRKEAGAADDGENLAGDGYDDGN